MQFYERLYTGERAEGKSVSQSFQNLLGKKFSLVYMLQSTPASKAEIIYLIFTTALRFSGPGMKKEDLLIVGIALGYDDACLLAGQIVNEVYRATGGFDVKQYLLKNVR